MALGTGNNFAALLVFLLIGTASTGMHLTNQNVQRVQLSLQIPETCFANEPNTVICELKNESKTKSFQLEISGNELSESVFTAEGGKSTACQIEWQPTRRGVTKFPRVTLKSSFPFSMLTAWKVAMDSADRIVFPQRSGSPTFPQGAGLKDEHSELGLFRELRELREFDSPRRIHWPSLGKHQRLLVKSFEEQSQGAQYLFRWEMTAHIRSIEGRLSQLSLWVDLAERMGSKYGLELDDFQSGLGNGAAHHLNCLEHLALYQHQSSISFREGSRR